MNEFIAKYQGQITGVLSGFDRLVLRGSLRALCGLPGMEQYLATERVLYKDFGQHVEQVSRRLKQSSVARAAREGRVIRYLSSSGISKEDVAQSIAAEQKITQGLICVLSSVEPCRPSTCTATAPRACCNWCSGNVNVCTLTSTGSIPSGVS